MDTIHLPRSDELTLNTEMASRKEQKNNLQQSTTGTHQQNLGRFLHSFAPGLSLEKKAPTY